MEVTPVQRSMTKTRVSWETSSWEAWLVREVQKRCEEEVHWVSHSYQISPLPIHHSVSQAPPFRGQKVLRTGLLSPAGCHSQHLPLCLSLFIATVAASYGMLNASPKFPWERTECWVLRIYIYNELVNWLMVTLPK